MITRNDVLKALGYSDARIEAIERTGHQLAIDIPQEVIRLADALADDELPYKCMGIDKALCTAPNGDQWFVRQIETIEAFKAAVIERLKGGT